MKKKIFFSSLDGSSSNKNSIILYASVYSPKSLEEAQEEVRRRRWLTLKTLFFAYNDDFHKGMLLLFHISFRFFSSVGILTRDKKRISGFTSLNFKGHFYDVVTKWIFFANVEIFWHPNSRLNFTSNNLSVLKSHNNKMELQFKNVVKPFCLQSGQKICRNFTFFHKSHQHH